MLAAIPPPTMATRPSSISNTPHLPSKGPSGRQASQELFTYNLDLALLSVLQRVDEFGREAVFKRRSEQEVYQNAWTTPSYWNWSSSGSYVSEASTPGASTPDTPDTDADVSFEPPRAWSMIRNQIQSDTLPMTVEPKIMDTETPLKRKLDDTDDSDDEWMHPKKKMRRSIEQPIFINELTPPLTPLSQARDFLKVVAPSPNDFTMSSRRPPLGEITPPNVDQRTVLKMTSIQRRSKRLRCLPP